MNPIEVTASGKPLSNPIIETFERRMGVSLPRDYKTFLLTSNGGKPIRNIVKHTKEGSTRIVEFHALGGGTTLRLQTPGGFDERPDGALAIAIDCGGNPILLSLARHDFGHIYWEDHEELSPREGLSLIANSFGAFADMLTQAPPPEITDFVEWLGQYGSEDDLIDYLSKNGTVESRSQEGLKLTLAQEAGRNANLALLKALVARGASIKGVLQFAVQSGDRQMIDYLLDDLKADINEKDFRGYTPKQCSFSDPEITAYLVGRGAK